MSQYSGVDPGDDPVVRRYLSEPHLGSQKMMYGKATLLQFDLSFQHFYEIKATYTL